MNDYSRHTTTEATDRVPDAYLAHIDEAVVGIEPTTVRLYRREARRFGAWCSAHALDPLRPSAAEIARYLAEIDASARRAAGIRSALRAVVRAAGIPSDEHGLRTRIGHPSSVGSTRARDWYWIMSSASPARNASR